MRHDNVRHDTVRHDNVRYDTVRYEATMLPVMNWWILQWIVKVPALVTLIVFDPLEKTPESKLPSSAVSE